MTVTGSSGFWTLPGDLSGSKAGGASFSRTTPMVEQASGHESTVATTVQLVWRVAVGGYFDAPAWQSGNSGLFGRSS